MKKAIGVNSPSKMARDEVGKWIAAGVGDGIGKYAKMAVRPARTMAENAVKAASDVVNKTGMPTMKKNIGGVIKMARLSWGAGDGGKEKTKLN